tara:strand:- start:48 stop:695 length:648 start_codon:yes stop_codon:yes gene_type:complete
MASTVLKPHENVIIQIGVKGISPFLPHAWSEKALRMLAMTAQERRKQPKGEREPEVEAKSCAYYCDDGSYGVPLTAFKASLINTAHKDNGLEKTLVKKSLFIPSDDSNLCVPMVYSKEPYVRTDTVRVGAGATDLRYRLCFEDWGAIFKISVDISKLSIQDVITLTDNAGFSVGIGDWRPERGGEFGRFTVDTSVPVEQLDPETLEPLAKNKKVA